jgi:hypothetical protein
MEGVGLQEECSKVMGGVLLQDEFYIFYTFLFVFFLHSCKSFFFLFFFFLSSKVVEEEDDEHMFIIFFLVLQIRQ